MKKISLLCVIMTMLMLVGCSNASTFDFDEFVNQYPTNKPIETIEDETTIKWVDGGYIPKPTTDEVIDNGKGILYRYFLNLDAGYRYVSGMDVYGDVIAYRAQSEGDYFIYRTTIFDEGKEQLYKTMDTIYSVACGENIIIWGSYNYDKTKWEVYVYENEEIYTISQLEKIEGITDLDVDGDYLIGYEYGALSYIYNMTTEKVVFRNDYEDKEPMEYVLRKYEDGYGMFYSEDEKRIRCLDVLGNVIYETEIDGRIYDYSANKDLIAYNDKDNQEVHVERRNGDSYTVKYDATNIIVSGKWVFMCNSEEGTLKVFSPDYPGLIWEMEYPGEMGMFDAGDKNQVFVGKQVDKGYNITVYTMK